MMPNLLREIRPNANPDLINRTLDQLAVCCPTICDKSNMRNQRHMLGLMAAATALAASVGYANASIDKSYESKKSKRHQAKS